MVELTQAVQYNGFAHAFTGDSKYAASVAQFVNRFFLDSKVGMNPSIEYGQVIRGPEKQVGQYLGILDFRGMVKVANAVKVLQTSNSKDWSADTNMKFGKWVNSYSQWLGTSAIGKKASEAPKYVIIRFLRNERIDYLS